MEIITFGIIMEIIKVKESIGPQRWRTIKKGIREEKRMLPFGIVINQIFNRGIKFYNQSLDY
jgi:hypothetical protein